MGTTAGGLRYPEGSDPANVPVVVQNLAEDVDTYKASKANPTFTGVASFPDGSASAPSITNTGDTNTGISFPAADAVQISTAGTARVYVNSSGNVGIGTSSPGSILSFGTNSIGTAGEPNVIRLYDTGVAGTSYGLGISSGLLSVISDGQVGIWTGDSEKLRVDTNGLITGTGTSLGSTTDFTVSISGTGWALGNATTEGKYIRIGKLVFAKYHVVFGTTSTFGTAQLSFNLPFSAANLASTLGHAPNGYAVDGSAGSFYELGGRIPTTYSTVELKVIGTNGLWANLTSTAPFTFADGDTIRFSIVYEAA